MRRTVANSVRRAKNDWFEQKAQEVVDKVMRGVGAWKDIRDLQRRRAGLLPTRPKAVRNLDGKLCATTADSLRRWKQHFGTVLNTPSMFSKDMINSFPSYAVRDGMACIPSLQEVRDVLSLIAGGRAGDGSGKGEVVPQDWRDALLVPVPKKGDLSLCDNWRGISLLDVVGKVFAKVIQQRLQAVVEEVVADS